MPPQKPEKDKECCAKNKEDDDDMVSVQAQMFEEAITDDSASSDSSTTAKEEGEEEEEKSPQELYEAVCREDLSKIVKLIAHGAAVNGGWMESALHKVAEMEQNSCSVALVKLLLLFGADPAVENGEGRCAEELAVGEETKEILSQAGKWKRAKAEFRAKAGNFKEILLEREREGSSPPTLSDLTQQRILKEKINGDSSGDGATTTRSFGPRLLSLDGGGIRGLVLIQLLRELEELLGESPLLPNYFDWVAGTSTGAFLALAMADGTSLEDCMRMYLRFKDEVLRPPKPYSAERIERFLQEHFGEERTMSELRHGAGPAGVRVVVTTTKADVNPAEMVLLRNYRFDDEGRVEEKTGIQLPKPMEGATPEEVKIWEAARKSGAAPTYFPTVDGCFMDGGLMANNPSKVLLSEVKTSHTVSSIEKMEHGKNGKEGGVEIVPQVACLVSLGTGRPPQKEVVGLDVSKLPGKKANPIEQVYWGWNNRQVAKNLGHMLVELVACSDGVVVEEAQTMCHLMGAPFWRFSPQLTEKVELDTRDDAKLVDLLWRTKVYANEECAQEMEMLAAYLMMTSEQNDQNQRN